MVLRPQADEVSLSGRSGISIPARARPGRFPNTARKRPGRSKRRLAAFNCREPSSTQDFDHGLP
jgi:hypothetical protein